MPDPHVGGTSCSSMKQATDHLHKVVSTQPAPAINRGNPSSLPTPKHVSIGTKK